MFIQLPTPKDPSAAGDAAILERMTTSLMRAGYGLPRDGAAIGLKEYLRRFSADREGPAARKWLNAWSDAAQGGVGCPEILADSMCK